MCVHIPALEVPAPTVLMVWLRARFRTDSNGMYRGLRTILGGECLHAGWVRLDCRRRLEFSDPPPPESSPSFLFIDYRWLISLNVKLITRLFLMAGFINAYPVRPGICDAVLPLYAFFPHNALNER